MYCERILQHILLGNLLESLYLSLIFSLRILDCLRCTDSAGVINESKLGIGRTPRPSSGSMLGLSHMHLLILGDLT